ncbi:hypothetical protein AB0K15_17710 [Amycolatopsis sp. NPDC049253]|uniref:hypothetical protein n=1 Tax=Amycolatopsis sp. NPDC049253 TaxID=3155274 RepID=UPI003423840D
MNVKGTVFTVKKALPLLNDNAAVSLTASISTVEGIEGLERVSVGVWLVLVDDLGLWMICLGGWCRMSCGRSRSR